MQKSAILQMFYGERGDVECVEMTKELRAALGVLVETNEKMRGELQEKADVLALYEKVCGAFDETHALESECYYTEGFRFGFLMALDVLGWKRD